MKPTKIQRSGEHGISVTWNDGHIGHYLLQALRDNCPCATCNESREQGSAILPVYEEGKYQLSAIKQVGQYAIQIKWQDGHDTGIYTFQFLRSLCTCDTCRTK